MTMDTDRTGLLLVNLGTPDRPDTAAVRRYLDEFLSDKRVIELSPLVWQPILKGIILRRRPPVTAANYRKIWDKVHDESPLRWFTSEQARKLQEYFGDRLLVRYAMRYGNPSIAAGLQSLAEAGVTRLCIAPLYPQYCSATTGTALAEVFRCLDESRHLPALRSLPPYHAHPAYIAALRQSLHNGLEQLDFTPEKIVLSFHGMPARTAELGDPYADHCATTARLLREACNRSAEDMPLAYQSRFGPAKWLKPYLLPLVEKLARHGCKRLAVMTPGFAVDCIETLEEVAMQVRDAFRKSGGEEFAAIPCLNDSATGMKLLTTLCEEELVGWIDQTA